MLLGKAVLTKKKKYLSLFLGAHTTSYARATYIPHVGGTSTLRV